jgi:hypothetical protein
LIWAERRTAAARRSWVVNALASGPTGPAGLELEYHFDGGWMVSVGAAYRVLRFRLSDTGLVSNGVGQETSVPVEASAISCAL